MKILKVDWIDARTFWDAMTLKELESEKMVNVTTVGHLVKEDDEKIILGSMIYIDGEVTMFKTSHIIPKVLIKKIEELEAKNVEKS